MKLLLVDNVILYRNKKGDYYAPTIYSYDFLKRYLEVFDEVRFIAKTQYVEEIDEQKCNLVSGPNVEILELPWYRGLKQMIKKIVPVMGVYKKATKGCDCCIFRIAQMESFFVYLFGGGCRKPYAVEVVNDPETFVDMPYVMRWFSVQMVKRMCKRAGGASYVTKYTLQKKYPNNDGFQSFYSSVCLSDSDIASKEIEYNKEEKFKIIHISNAINSDIKGHETLIKMAEYVVNKGKKIKVICVGDGILVSHYRDQVTKRGLDGVVNFIGRLNCKEDILALLRSCNLMVLPTKMEGLPRTIIEAMAVGLPCLSTPIAGIPELLDAQYMFLPEDYIGFGDKVIELMDSKDELTAMSRLNLEKSKEFRDSILKERRTQFYSQLRKMVEGM